MNGTILRNFRPMKFYQLSALYPDTTVPTNTRYPLSNTYFLPTKLNTIPDSTVNSTLYRSIPYEHYTLPVNLSQSGRVYRLGMNLENSSSKKFFQST